MKGKKIRVGVLGCANIATRSIIPTIIELNNIFELAGIASRSASKVDETVKLFQTKAFYSYQDLICDKGIDAIYIPLPNAMHKEWVERALEEKKHVLVEKSLACTLQEVEYLNQLASQNECVLIENFQFRFHKQIEVIKTIIEDGQIGELRSIYTSFGFPPFADKDNIRYNKDLGGGALLDAGAYPIKISQLFLGADVTVQSSSLYLDPQREVDIYGGGFIKQRNGSLFANVAFGFDNQYQCRIEFWGSKGKLTAPRVFTAPPNNDVELILETGQEKKVIKVEKSNHFRSMLCYFHELITTNNKDKIQREYHENVTQARLIEEFKNQSVR